MCNSVTKPLCERELEGDRSLGWYCACSPSTHEARTTIPHALTWQIALTGFPALCLPYRGSVRLIAV